MKKYKRERTTTEFEADAGSITGGVLNEACMSRRNFLRRIMRWSAAIGVFGLGAEGWTQAVSRRSLMSSAVAAEPPRNMQLHPFPSDDTFNLPLGVNAWYAPLSDPATAQVAVNDGRININNGASQPIYFSTREDPLTEIWHVRFDQGGTVRSYRPDENGTKQLYERLPTGALPAIHSGTGFQDRHLHIIIDSELVEVYHFNRDGGDYSGQTSASGRHIVRNRLNHYAHSAGSDPLKNTQGTRAWGGSAIAGLMRKHEIDTENPHIPHALLLNMHRTSQNGNAGKGVGDSPNKDISHMFPAHTTDRHGFPDSVGHCRMGMRFALDPTICTDAWIASNAPNKYHAAMARALRDYGGIIGDSGPNRNTFEAEPGIPTVIENQMRLNGVHSGWGWMMIHMRRVAGRTTAGGSPIHQPLESHWDTWRNAGQGWGGGAPRVPYPRPLSGSISPPGAPPEAPPAIQVTGAAHFDGAG